MVLIYNNNIIYSNDKNPYNPALKKDINFDKIVLKSSNFPIPDIKKSLDILNSFLEKENSNNDDRTEEIAALKKVKSNPKEATKRERSLVLYHALRDYYPGKVNYKLEQQRYDLVCYLISLGINVNTQTKKGYSLFHVVRNPKIAKKY